MPAELVEGPGLDVGSWVADDWTGAARKKFGSGCDEDLVWSEKGSVMKSKESGSAGREDVGGGGDGGKGCDDRRSIG